MSLLIKPFKCDSCDKCFTEKFNLTKHKKKHSKPQSISKEQELVNLLQDVKNIENDLILKKARITELEILLFEKPL